MMLFATPEGWGQSEFLRVNSSTANNSIVRAYGTKKLVYVENVTKGADGYSITSCSNKFILADASGNLALEASLNSNSLKWQIRDVKILGDTAYICGYQDVSTGSTMNLRGFIGYFSIMGLFGGTDVFHILRFNQYPSAVATESSISINQPWKIEPLAVAGGVHIFCTGRSGNSTHVVNNTFVADIVHSYRDDLWWYYVSQGGIEQFSDITLTDNYAASIANKENNQTFFLRMYNKPQAVTYNSSSYLQDASFFYARNQATALHSYNSYWTHPTGINHNIQCPRITHTEEDSVAIAYLTHEEVNGSLIYGATVKHFSLSNVINQIDNLVSLDADIVAGFRNSIDLAMSSEAELVPGATEAPIGSGSDDDDDTEGDEGGVGVPNYAVPVYYNRMVKQAVRTETGNSFRLEDVVYHGDSRKLYLLQPESYQYLPISEHNKIFSFNIYDPDAPVMIMRPQQSHYIRSIFAESNDPSNLSVSGYAPTNGGLLKKLLFGEIGCNSEHCIGTIGEQSVEDPQGQLVGKAYVGGHLEFGYKRVDPVPIYPYRQDNNAFEAIRLPAQIRVVSCSVVCE